MKKLSFLKTMFLFVMLILVSCDKNESVEDSLPGEWIEVEPVADRTVLIFSSGNRLTRIDGEGNEEYYIYKIEEDSILLSLASGPEGTTELYFKKLDPGKFRIENLYPSIPENEKVIMVFERT